MTLIQKITDKVQDLPLEANPTQKDIDNYYLSINNLIVIADEFAVGFADWIRVCKLKQRPYDFDNIKELLEIYKKEKEL